jgi:hypothetical protein
MRFAARVFYLAFGLGVLMPAPVEARCAHSFPVSQDREGRRALFDLERLLPPDATATNASYTLTRDGSPSSSECSEDPDLPPIEPVAQPTGRPESWCYAAAPPGLARGSGAAMIAQDAVGRTILHAPGIERPPRLLLAAPR